MKKIYQTPKMETMDCKVEKGFTISASTPQDVDHAVAANYSTDFNWEW